MPASNAILTVAQMYRADVLTIAGGTPGGTLMEAAGAAVVQAIVKRWRPRDVAILCGPGNNGGDGFVIARLLKALGWPVRVGLVGELAALEGDAAIMARHWADQKNGEVQQLSSGLLDGAGLVVDALFGAGLSRPLDGASRMIIEDLANRGVPIVAVDVPSGVSGDTGTVLGAAARATLTVTFFRKKPAHLLLPGRVLCGEVVVADIGIADDVLDAIAPTIFKNDPALWLDGYPWPRLDGHKFDRGHAVVFGGARMTGAARLAARAARRVGAGLVSIACDPNAFPIYAASDPGTIVSPLDTPDGFAELMSDERRNAVLVGPGAGMGDDTRRHILAALGAGKSTVIDADGLTAFADCPGDLYGALTERCLLTPHAGEFKRLFGIAGDKLTQARSAAARAGAVVLVKGADTVVAAPDGRAVINANAPPDLATAGAGDVLAGLAVGLMAQRMPAFEAACAAVWLHGESAAIAGPGLIAEDLAEALPTVLRHLRDASPIPP